MTLILTLATPAYVLQVSDRAVTRLATGEVYDSLANKNVIFLASNAVVTMGYSGMAYTDGVPTDRWIAQQLWGEPIQDYEAGTPPSVSIRDSRRHVSIKHAVDALLRTWASTLLPLQPVRALPQLAIAGWQDGLSHPLVWIYQAIMTPAGDYAFTRRMPPRSNWWLGNRSWLEWTPNSWLRTQDVEALTEQLASAAHSPTAAKEILVDVLRSVAERSTSVGRDCLCVLIPNDGSQTVHVSYESAMPHRAALPRLPDETNDPLLREVLRSLEYEFSAIFSPWVVGPAGLYAPSLVSPGTRMLLETITVCMDGNANHGLSGMSSQRRPPPI